MNESIGQVLKILNGNIQVLLNEKIVLCDIRGSLKKNGRVLVGDIAKLEKDESSDKYIITNILKRKNVLIRPTLANLDQLFIVIAKKPEPDFLLVDKLIVYCEKNKIIPFLVINKKDLFSDEEIENIKFQYKGIVKEILLTNAKKGELSNLKDYLVYKLSAFAGQSAVGKSTLINAIIPRLHLETNILSLKIERGKHTTRHSEIYISDNIKLTDTPGFSMLDLEMNPKDLKNYYLDMQKFANNCEFLDCCHVNTSAKYCGVVRAVEIGEYSSERFERYCNLYNKVKQNWEKRYD